MPNTRPRLGVIVGSTRDARFADKPAHWLMSHLSKDDYFASELIDLKTFDLPFFNEMASNMLAPSRSAKALAWQSKIAEFDAYIFITAEYNYSIPAALKNALDQAYNEWNHKPFAVMGYGGLGAARAAQDLRSIGVALQMVPVAAGVHVGGAEFLNVHPLGRGEPFDVLDNILLPSFNTMMDQLEWWTDATLIARRADKGTIGKRSLHPAEMAKTMGDSNA